MLFIKKGNPPCFVLLKIGQSFENSSLNCDKIINYVKTQKGTKPTNKNPLKVLHSFKHISFTFHFFPT